VTINLIACDKDSSGGYTKTYEFENKGQFLTLYNEFKEEVPFARWYLDVTSNDEDSTRTENLVESWLED